MNIRKMTKLILVIAIFSHVTIFAEYAFDESTDKHYSKNAPKSVNQEEYHCLISSILRDIYPRLYRHLNEP